jgi:hypothetical protein
MTTRYKPTPTRLERDLKELLSILAVALAKLERQRAA